MPANDEKTTREPEKKKNKMFKFFSLGCRGRSREESHERANKTVSTCDVVSLNGESKKKKKETSAKGSFSVTTLKETQSMNNLSRTSREMFCTKIVEQKPLDEARRDARATPIEDADEARADSEILSNYSTAAPFSEGGTGESFEVFAGFLPLNSENILETSVFEKDQSQPLARRKIAQILKEPGDSPVPSVTSEEDSFAEERLDSLNPDAEASYSFVRNFKERLSIGGSMRQIKRRRRLSWSTPERPLSATEIPTSLPPEAKLVAKSSYNRLAEKMFTREVAEDAVSPETRVFTWLSLKQYGDGGRYADY
ncbi:unnamed protein product [Caenorhabditis auriculariae]|uniref:Uncharacterized protein n=1 Tax=Caenorhabditis auriculariae TaxID=2777116 RepID=A0A8S1HRP8_9PELO|nr:unnamed protein product [Caenorhabditis auriculariae]